jgi:hypothetical protein
VGKPPLNLFQMLLLVLRRWQGMQHGNECHLDDDPGPVMVRGRGSNHSKAQNKSDRAIQIARHAIRVYDLPG